MKLPKKRFRFTDSEPLAQANPGSFPRATGGRPLSREDERNIEAYVEKISEAVALLQTEIDALKEGDLDAVGIIFDRKASLMKWLELRSPLIEPFLSHEFARKLNIGGRIAELKHMVEEDRALLSRMAVAARTILREIEKVNRRGSLGDSYTKNGQKRGELGKKDTGLDQQY